MFRKKRRGYPGVGHARRSLSSAPRKIKLLAYKTLCRPKLEFAVEVWDPSFKGQPHMLEMLQNRAVRFVSGLKGRDGVTREKELLGLDSLEYRRKIQRVRTFHLIQQSKNPSFNELNEYIEQCFNNERPNTRAKQQGQPLAVLTNRTPYFNSFIPRTTRDMRIF